MTCSCNKRAYSTRAEARRLVRQMKAKGWPPSAVTRGRLQAYHCDDDVWHIGHAPMQLVVTYRRRRAA